MRARDVVARSVGLILAIGLWLAPGLPASGQAEPASSRHLAPAAQPQHGGGGFALLLLDYRVALERVIEDLRGRTAELAAGAEMAPAEIMAAVQRVTAGTEPVLLVAGLLAILGMAFLARHAVRRRLAGEQPTAASDASDGFGARLGRALYRALVDLLALGAFALVAVALVAIFVPAPGPARTFIVTYLTAALVALAAALVARFALAPDAPGARLLPLSDRAAHLLHRWLVTLATVGSVAWLSAALLILSGMALEAHLVLALAIGALIGLLLVGMILESRPLVAAALLGEHPRSASPLRARLARSWHGLAIVYLVVIWALWAASIVTRGPSSLWSAVASVLLAAALPLLDQAFGRALAQILGADEPAAAGRERTIAIIRRTLRIVLAAVALILLPSFWGFDVLRLVGAPGAGVFSHALFNILVTTLIAYVAWQLAESALDRSLAAQPASARRQAPGRAP